MSTNRQNLEDFVEISDLLASYGHALDDKDWELLRSLFLPDATFDYSGSGIYDNYSDLETLARTTMARYSSTQHLIGSVRISTHGDEGTSHCYAQAAHVLKSGAMRMTGTSYYDTLRRTSDGWRIASRRLERLWGEGPQDEVE
jgi:3-phenylpropionate/cinnamic acid dioxygenase small subunit